MMSDKDLQKMDSPEPLMEMMATLLSSYEIHNWSIYSNNSKNTCLVIRFSDTDGCTQSAHYRRISNTRHSIAHTILKCVGTREMLYWKLQWPKKPGNFKKNIVLVKIIC